MSTVSLAVAARPRAFVRVAGPDALDYLQRMLSNDVAVLAVGASCEALLLTAKARVIAPLVVWRRGEDDFLLLTEPELGQVVRGQLLRMRLAAKVEIEAEDHTSAIVFGPAEGIPTFDYGEQAVEVLDGAFEATMADEELEVLRICARTARYGREVDDRVLPAEAGLVERAVSFTKGCYPGQEPIARLHYRGHVNRSLRVRAIDALEPPPYDAEVMHGGKPVGRVTSAVRDGDRVVALAYVRIGVPDDAALAVGGVTARLH
jgi:folate-binding protein YgfZ